MLAYATSLRRDGFVARFAGGRWRLTRGRSLRAFTLVDSAKKRPHGRPWGLCAMPVPAKCRAGSAAGARARLYIRSMTPAMPCPPPMHIVMSP